MELLAAATLLGGGLFLKKSRDKRMAPQNDSMNQENIYNTNQFCANQDYEFQQVHKQHKLSSDFINTNIIPRYVNSLYSAANMVKNPDYNSKLIYSVIETFDENTKDKIKKLDNQPELPEEITGSILPNRGHEPRNSHNNMVPFFGGKMTQNMNLDNRLSEDKLELFTGQMKLNKPKEEIEPMFKPVKDLAWVNGSVEQRDLSRYVPSNLGKANNELPFEQVKVGRGLNQGYTAKPSGGFHPTLRIMPTKPEEYRLDPVFEQEGRIIKGKSIEKRGMHAQVSKNKQSLLIENKNGERNFTTVGVIKGRKIRPTINIKTTGRTLSGQVIGPGYKNIGSKSRTKIKLTNKQSLKAEPFRNLTQEGKMLNEYGKEGYYNMKNPKRTMHNIEIKGHIHGSSNLQNKLYNYQDAKKTRKQTLVINKHKHLNLTDNGTKKGMTYDPHDVAKTTVKETTLIENYVNNVNMPHKKTITYDPHDVAKTTIKETTLIENHVNNVNMPHKKTITYDPHDVAKTTIKETTLIENHVNNVNMPNKKAITYDPHDVAKTTVKETTLIENHTNNVNMPHKKAITYDPADVARYTNKQELSNNSYKGGAISKSKKSKSYADAYNAETNINKEVIAQGRKPTNSCAKLFNSNKNIQVNKLDEDRQNYRSNVKNSNFGNVFNNKYTLTSVKNELPEEDIRLDVKTLDGLKQNPLALRKPIFA